MNIAEIEFKDYKKERPQEEGLYIWRAKHQYIKDMTITFLGEFRWRGNGHNPMVLSPDFDFWDGYRIHLIDCEWCDYEGEGKSRDIIKIDGCELLPCPFCGKTPKFESFTYHPTNTDEWFISDCCFLSRKIYGGRDPRELCELRNGRLIDNISKLQQAIDNLNNVENKV